MVKSRILIKMKKVIQTSINNKTDWRFELNAFLRSYRSTPHSSTNKSPASLIFINCNTSRLPAKQPQLSPEQKSEILITEINDRFAKNKTKIYADKRRRATTNKFKIGDHVMFHQLNSKIHHKYKNQFSNTSCVIKDIKGSKITVVNSSNKELTRNSSFFKRAPSNIKINENYSDIEELTKKSAQQIASINNQVTQSQQQQSQQQSQINNIENTVFPLA